MHLGWVITWIVIAILIALYIWAIVFARKRQKSWNTQYQSLKERHEVFVLNKKTVRERPKTGLLKRVPMKTYQVVGRISMSQAVRGMQMSKMQTVTFHTTKQQYEKIQPNHKYKMDIAGNYIGLVVSSTANKSGKKSAGAAQTTPAKGFLRRFRKDKTTK